MYTYEPLGHREIRLLDVVRSDTAPHGLHLNLRKTSLDQAPSFAGLSYTWEVELEHLTSQGGNDGFDGSATAPRKEQLFNIQCGDGFLEVRENLFHFLQWLQTCEEPATFWIDAICINQDDLDERAEQVVLMGDIYRRASKVHIWLGQTPISEGAMSVIHDFIPAVLRDWNLRGPSGTRFYSERDMLCNDEELRLSIGPKACEIWRSHWQDFIRIFERRWFSRGWIVQEVCIRDLHACTFVAGTHEVDYRHLEDFDKFLVRTGWTQQLYQRTRDLNMVNARGAMGSFSNLRDILSALAYKHEHNTLYLEAIYGVQTEEQAWYAAYSEVISRMRWRGLQDPRDIVYASLGMMTTVAPSNMPTRINPDYHLAVTEVYTRFAALLLQQHRFMNLLCLRDDPSDRQHQELPSWVPDFSVGMSQNTLIRASDFYRDQHGHNYVFGRKFNASQTDAEDESFREVHGQTLELHGTMLTTVDWCGPEDALLTALSAAKLAAQSKIHPNTSDSMYDAVWKTLIVDDPPPSLDRQHCPESFRSWLLVQLAQLWRESQENFEGSAEHRLRLQEMESVLTQTDDSEESARCLPTIAEVMRDSADLDGLLKPSNQSFHVAYMVALRGRRLFTTSAGHIALGPRSLRQDDEVWLIKGVKVPLVLRRNSDAGTHTLIGESYVHGCMYGEAMTDELRTRCGPVKII